MRISKVSYQKAYIIGPYLQHKLGFEAELEQGDNPNQVLDELKQLADTWDSKQPKQSTDPSELPIIRY